MLRTRPPKVNPNPSSRTNSWQQTWLWGTSGATWHKDQRTIWLLFGLPTLILWLSGYDTTLAHLTFAPTEAKAFATFLRHYGTLPGTLMAALGLIALLWPGLWKSRPLLYRTALITALTAILGVGLINQVIVKDLVQRPRPIESTLASSPAPDDGFRGNSMPSGHAAMGFLIAAPFFPLRRQKPKLAATFLGAGLIAGALVGLSRMALGAHFATDVLIAAAITLSSASLFTHLTANLRRLHPTITPAIILAMALAVILGNRFTNLQLTLIPTPHGPINSFDMPCTMLPKFVHGAVTPTFVVTVSGYGAPLSNLKLVQNQNIISLQRNRGLYHHLTCTAYMAIPIK